MRGIPKRPRGIRKAEFRPGSAAEARCRTVPADLRRRGAARAGQADAENRFPSLARLQAAAVNVNIQPVLAIPTQLDFAIPPTVFIQPEVFSIRLRVRRLPAQRG